jgi:hypothetical protein
LLDHFSHLFQAAIVVLDFVVDV